MTPVALTIAGSDPSGGAGLQADLKTFHRFGVYGEAAVTLITVQNTRGVTRVSTLDPELVTAQIQAVIADIPPQAAKVGALGSREIVEAVARDAEWWRAHALRAAVSAKASFGMPAHWYHREHPVFVFRECVSRRPGSAISRLCTVRVDACCCLWRVRHSNVGCFRDRL